MYPYDNYNNFNMQQPYNFNNQQFNRPQNQSNTNKIYVSGIDDVKKAMLPAGSDYIFLDNDKPILYQKIVSPNGQFEVKTFTISPYEQKETTNEQNPIDLSGYVKTSELEQIRAELNELKNKLTPKKVEVNNGTTGTTNKSI